MDKNRWEHIQTLFSSVMELEPGQRDTYLGEACFGDKGLVAEVRSLMDADGLANEVLDKVSLTVDKENTVTIGLNKQFGPYKVVGKIGMGGMGVVYKGIDSRLDRHIAIKCLSPQLDMDENVRQRFVIEAKAASRLDHPNICVIYDIGETPDKQLYFTMPFYEGETLKQRINKSPMAAADVLSIATHVGEGLDAAHNEGILHRDIKPANIMLTNDGGVKILDFGVAKISGVENTNTGAALGTVAYMSPEQIQGHRVDRRADVWSLGVILYEMFVGRRPFKGKYTHEIMYSVLHDEAELVSSQLPEAPALLDEIILSALNRDLEKRYQTVSELLKDLLLLRQRWSCADSVILKPGDNQGEPGSSSAVSSGSSTNWDKTTLDSISKELMKYVGPMASYMVKKKSLETHSIKELCHKLADSVPDEKEREQFLRRIRHRDLTDDNSVSDSSSKMRSDSSHFSLDDLVAIEQALTVFLGPISGKLVKRSAKKAADLQSLCMSLAEKLNQDEKSSFIRQVSSLYK